MAQRFPAAGLTDASPEAILSVWDSLERIEEEAALCAECQGLDECRLPRAGWRLSAAPLGSGAIEIMVQPCRFLAPKLAQAEWERRLRSARLERRFWERTFDSYHPQTPEQELAKNRCRQWAETYEPRKTRRGLFLAGPVGTGKSHLAAAVLLEVMRRHEDVLGMFLPCVDFMEELRAAIGTGERDADELVAEAAEAPLLVLDDLGGNLEWESTPSGPRLSAGFRGTPPVTDFERRTLYRIINRRYEAALPIIVTTNCPIEVLEQAYGSRAVSRLIEDTDGVLVTGPDYRKRRLQE